MDVSDIVISGNFFLFFFFFAFFYSFFLCSIFSLPQVMFLNVISDAFGHVIP